MGFQTSRESLAHIALHRRREAILADAVATARRMTRADSAFGAVRRKSGTYAMTLLDGLHNPHWQQVRVAPGRGLGGQVLTEQRPYTCSDYLCESGITGDYRTIVGAEGLHAMACVPIRALDGIAMLLYASDRQIGGIGDRLVDQLTRIADMATVGLEISAETEPAEAQPSVRLTGREREVLELLAEGTANRAIAAQLAIAEPTAKGHVRSLLEKFGASSRLEVVAFARREGLL
jgi:DNA-binding CsgD family transcriptional regulator